MLYSSQLAEFALVDVSSGWTVKISITLRLAADFLHVMYIKDKHLLVFNFIFDSL
jgi:hypothetical protein